jgi:hypothetical protein
MRDEIWVSFFGDYGDYAKVRDNIYWPQQLLRVGCFYGWDCLEATWDRDRQWSWFLPLMLSC